MPFDAERLRAPSLLKTLLMPNPARLSSKRARRLLRAANKDVKDKVKDIRVTDRSA